LDSRKEALRMRRILDIVVIGLSMTSSWGNGHATTYRGLLRALAGRGHRVLFLERDTPWYAAHRDLPRADFARIELYADSAELQRRFTENVRQADLVLVGSYVPEGVAVCAWVLEHAEGAAAFYDIDTPVTLAKLRRQDHEYLHPDLIPRFDLYLSFTGGPILDELESVYGALRARPLYCSVDPSQYRPLEEWRNGNCFDLGYMGTYSADRQPALNQLLVGPARLWSEGRFIVAGPQFPEALDWPANVCRQDHLAPADHCAFYNSQRFTLNVTRQDMVASGYAPSVRLFEAAACRIPVISDYWPGLETFFTPGEEILISYSTEETLYYLQQIPEDVRKKMAAMAHARILAEHTPAHRARELEAYVGEVLG
jgi:spore maturation protein CgeB